MRLFEQIQQWHQTTIGLIVFAMLEAALAYIFFSWAIDKGNPLDWFLTIVLIIGVLQNITKLIIKAVKHA